MLTVQITCLDFILVCGIPLAFSVCRHGTIPTVLRTLEICPPKAVYSLWSSWDSTGHCEERMCVYSSNPCAFTSPRADICLPVQILGSHIQRVWIVSYAKTTDVAQTCAHCFDPRWHEHCPQIPATSYIINQFFPVGMNEAQSKFLRVSTVSFERTYF